VADQGATTTGTARAAVSTSTQTEQSEPVAESGDCGHAATLFSGNSTSGTASCAFGEVAGSIFGGADIASGNLSSVTVAANVRGNEDLRAEVTVPASAISALYIEQNIAIVITRLSEEASIPETTIVKGQSAVRATVSWLNGTEIPIKGLAEPILVKLPVSFSEGLVCAFWNETSQVWDESGVTTLTTTIGDQMVCETSHLTIFAAIFRGFRDTFACTQFSLFNEEAFASIPDRAWTQTTPAIMFFSLLGFLSLMFAVGAFVDNYRYRHGGWQHAFFLITDDVLQAQERDLNIDNMGEDPELEPDETKGSRWKRVCGPILTCGLACVTCVRTSNALRDAVDDIVGNYVKFFSEIRDLIEQVWEALGCCGGGHYEGHLVARLSLKILGSSIFAVARRHISGCLNVSQDTVDMFLEDENVHALLQKRFPDPADINPVPDDGGGRSIDLDKLLEAHRAGLRFGTDRKNTEELFEVWENFIAANGAEPENVTGEPRDEGDEAQDLEGAMEPHSQGAALEGMASNLHDGQGSETPEEEPIEGLPDHQFIPQPRLSVMSVPSEGSRPEAPQGCEVKGMFNETAVEDTDDGLPRQAPAVAEQREAGGEFEFGMDLRWLPPKRPGSSPSASECTLPEAPQCGEVEGMQDNDVFSEPMEMTVVEVDDGTALARSASRRLRLREDTSVVRPTMFRRVRLREDVQVVPQSDDARDREELLAEMYIEVNKKLNGAFYQIGWVSRLPRVVARGFLVQTPLVATFARDFQISCKLRAFLFALETLGSVTLAAIFFSATGAVSGRRARSDCVASGDTRELLGRLLGLGIGSAIIAGLPASFLQSLHTRGFKTVPRKKGPEWHRQLLAWRIQDIMVYSFGIFYGLLMLAFQVLFLANISEKDGRPILISAGISLGQDLVVVPFAIALFSPAMAVISTAVLSLIQGASRDDIIYRRYLKVFSKDEKLQHGLVEV